MNVTMCVVKEEHKGFMPNFIILEQLIQYYIIAPSVIVLVHPHSVISCVIKNAFNLFSSH